MKLINDNNYKLQILCFCYSKNSLVKVSKVKKTIGWDNMEP